MDKANYAEFQKARKTEENKLTNMSEFSARGTCLSGITLIRRIRTQSFGGWIFAIIGLNFYNTNKLDIQKKKKKKSW